MNEIIGAVDLRKCPDWPKICKCPKCAKCGFGLHYAVHGPKFDGLPGSEPYCHQYEPSGSQVKKVESCPNQ